MREAEWRVADCPPALLDRRVEITGPTDRKMTINALNSGARIWLADFEDATAPTWENVIGGQLNLIDAYERRVDFADEHRASPTRCGLPRSWPPSSSARVAGTWRSGT